MDSISAASLAARGVAYAPEILSAATAQGLDPALLAAVAAQETGGPNSNAGRNVVGDGGHGHGLFQIDDRYHAFARTAAAMAPAANAEYAAAMLAELIRRYGSVRRALSAYNAGAPDAVGTVTEWRDGSRLGYADSVLRHEALIAGLATSPQMTIKERTMAFLLPLAAGAGASLLGGLARGASGAAENAAMGAINAQDEAFQLGLYGSQIANQEQLSLESTLFDQMMDERSENMREVNELRNVDMQERKADDDITKKFIQTLTQ